MKLIVVGGGGTTRDLLRGLSDLWEVTVVDPDGGRLDLAGDVRQIEAMRGDGSSRVVLGRAGLARVDAVVAASNDDDVNLEVCRIAADAGVGRVVALAVNPERIDEYRGLGVPVFSPDRLVARRMGLNLEPRGVSSATFADGRAVAIEIQLGLGSAVVGKTLGDLGAERWLVAAILREGRLIVPHGETVLEVGDLVTVAGAASDYSLIVRSFTADEARFPMDFGRQVVVIVQNDTDLDVSVREAVAVTRNSAAESLFVVHRSLDSMKDETEAGDLEAALARLPDVTNGVEVRIRAVPGPPLPRLVDIVRDESVGLIVSPTEAGRKRFGRQGLGHRLRVLRTAAVPVLFARGLESYEQVALPVRGEPDSWEPARAAIDLADYGQATLLAVAVVPPIRVGGVENRDAALLVLRRLREEATVRGVPMRRRVRRGSLARVLEEVGGPGLTVLPFREHSTGVQQQSVSAQLIKRAPGSVLLVPGE
jgi:Trk K+ transport system NAD-binding subunit